MIEMLGSMDFTNWTEWGMVLKAIWLLIEGNQERFLPLAIIVLIFSYLNFRLFRYIRKDKAIKSCVVKDDSIIRDLIFIIFRYDRTTKKFWHRIGRGKFAYFENEFTLMYQWAIPYIISRLLVVIGVPFLIINHFISLIPQSILVIVIIVYGISVLVYDEICHVVNQKTFKRQYESQFSEEDFKD